MWSEVSPIRQPHDGALEANKQGEQNEFEQERQLYLRAQRAGKLAREIIKITDHYVSGGDTRGTPYCMISEPIKVQDLSIKSGQKIFNGYLRICVGFDTDERKEKEVKEGKWLRSTTIRYIPDFEKIRNVGVIYLDADTLAHEGSAHWTRDESAPLEEITDIEKGLAASQQIITELSATHADIAS